MQHSNVLKKVLAHFQCIQTNENFLPTIFVKICRWWDDFAERVRQNKAFLGMVANQYSCVCAPFEVFVKGILAANSLVFCLWRVPPLHHFMTRYFQSSFGKKGNEVVVLLIDHAYDKLLWLFFRLHCVNATCLLQSCGVLASCYKHASTVELHADL